MERLNIILYRAAQLLDRSQLNLPNQTTDNNALSARIQSALSIVFVVLGAISVLVIAIAGIQYILSGGDPQKTAKAKDTILYAVIGLVISILAFTIVQFVTAPGRIFG